MKISVDGSATGCALALVQLMVLYEIVIARDLVALPIKVGDFWSIHPTTADH